MFLSFTGANRWELWVGEYDGDGADLVYRGALETLDFAEPKQLVAQLLEEKRIEENRP